ncbi:MAG: hypothetical protein HY807_08940 [Nitrospirae bacterium]|nr:hypothetical protein [Nitrospirota bacterium]
MDKDELGWLAGRQCPLANKRVVERRTRRDRRSVFKNHNYTGRQRRHMKRRTVINRRHVYYTDKDGNTLY